MRVSIVAIVRPFKCFLIASAVLLSPVAAEEGGLDRSSQDDGRVRVSPGIGDRPIVRRESGRVYLAPKALSPGTKDSPFIKPEYYEAPTPPNDEHESGTTTSRPLSNGVPPGGRMKPLP